MSHSLLCSLVTKYFRPGCIRPFACCAPGAIAPSAPVSYATGRSRGNLRDLSRAVGVDVARGISSYHIISYQKFIVRQLLREPRPWVHYKSQPNAKIPRKTQKSTNVKSLTKAVRLQQFSELAEAAVGRNVRRILVRGANAPLPPEAKKILKMVHSEVYLNKYVVSIAPFSTPACPDCSQNIT